MKIRIKPIRKKEYKRSYVSKDILPETIKESNEIECFVFSRMPVSSWTLGLIFAVLSIGLGLYHIPTFILTTIYSVNYRLLGIIGIIVLFCFIVFNILFILKAINEIRFAFRYDKLKKRLENVYYEIIDFIAEDLKTNHDTVVQDLNHAVRTKLIPQGHFSSEDVAFLVSDAKFADYSANKVVYDRYFKDLIDERKRQHNVDVSEIMIKGNSMLEDITGYKKVIKSRIISEKINRVSSIVSAVFDEVSSNVYHINKLGIITDVYIPKFKQLLDSYADIDKKRIKTQSLVELQNETIGTLDSIIDACEVILENLQEEIRLDLTSEIYAIRTVMKQEESKNI